MTLNQLIEELTFYAKVMSAGDYTVKMFTGIDEDSWTCNFQDLHDATITMDDHEIHLWPTDKKG